MNKVLFGLFIGFSFLSCSKKEEVKKENEPYIISKFDRELKEELKKTGKVILVNIPFYFSDQIIIDQEGNTFYIQKSFPLLTPDAFCETNLKEKTVPYFINLSLENLIEIPKNGLNNFINENSLKNAKNKNFIMIVSQSDTIKNNEFLKFLKTIKSRFKYYKIRRTTQEEDTVFYYKKLNKPYYPDSIKWDKSKIKFKE